MSPQLSTLPLPILGLGSIRWAQLVALVTAHLLQETRCREQPPDSTMMLGPPHGILHERARTHQHTYVHECAHVHQRAHVPQYTYVHQRTHVHQHTYVHQCARAAPGTCPPTGRWPMASGSVVHQRLMPIQKGKPWRPCGQLALTTSLLSCTWKTLVDGKPRITSFSIPARSIGCRAI